MNLNPTPTPTPYRCQYILNAIAHNNEPDSLSWVMNNNIHASEKAWGRIFRANFNSLPNNTDSITAKEWLNAQYVAESCSMSTPTPTPNTSTSTNSLTP